MNFGDVTVDVDDALVATVEIHRPPNNYFDTDLINAIADAYGYVDDETPARAIVLCAEGKHFCAGADFGGQSGAGRSEPGELYRQAVRLFEAQTPVIAAVQGAAIGGGLGLACSADFRVASPDARLSANFARLGFHHGFGLTVTLPAIVGQQRALELLYTARRIKGDEAVGMGLCDILARPEELRVAAHSAAAAIAEQAPLALRSIRSTMRGHLADAVRAATDHELEEQGRLQQTADFAEGIRAAAERRTPNFEGR